MSYLLDTNVVSEARKAQANPQVRAWLASVGSADLYLSVLAIGEIRQGLERIRPRDMARAAALELWLDRLHQQFAGRLIPITVEIAEEWGRLNSQRTLPVVDGLMAATARVTRHTLVTRNVADVAGTGVSLINPFDFPSEDPSAGQGPAGA